jgi:hypothetical protein
VTLKRIRTLPGLKPQGPKLTLQLLVNFLSEVTVFPSGFFKVPNTETEPNRHFAKTAPAMVFQPNLPPNARNTNAFCSL